MDKQDGAPVALDVNTVIIDNTVSVCITSEKEQIVQVAFLLGQKRPLVASGVFSDSIIDFLLQIIRDVRVTIENCRLDDCIGTGTIISIDNQVIAS